MAKWRPATAPRIEPPSWYRTFDPGMWDEPDAQELAMTSGARLAGGELHRYHAERRWHEAKHAYRRAHPALATQELGDLFARRAERREGPG